MCSYATDVAGERGRGEEVVKGKASVLGLGSFRDGQRQRQRQAGTKGKEQGKERRVEERGGGGVTRARRR